MTEKNYRRVKVTMLVPLTIEADVPLDKDDRDQSISRQIITNLSMLAINESLRKDKDRKLKFSVFDGVVHIGHPYTAGLGGIAPTGKRILILKEHHGNRYFDISTREMHERVALSIIKGRFGPDSNNDMYFIGDEEEQIELPTMPATTREQVEALADGAIKKAGLEEWENYDSHLRYYERVKAEGDLIKKCLAENNGHLAIRLLDSRKRYADEGFEIETVNDEYRV